MLPPIRVTRTLKPRTVWSPRPGVHEFDFGENIAGRVRLIVPGGRRLLVKHAERPDAGDDFWCFGTTGYQQFGVIGADEPVRVAPRFSYHGFQYVRVYDEPDAESEASASAYDVVAEHVHTDLRSVGSFRCSSDILNRIHDAVRLTFLNNFHSIPTDCPHREKLGWLFDAYAACEAGVTTSIWQPRTRSTSPISPTRRTSSAGCRSFRRRANARGLRRCGPARSSWSHGTRTFFTATNG